VLSGRRLCLGAARDICGLGAVYRSIDAMHLPADATSDCGVVGSLMRGSAGHRIHPVLRQVFMDQ